VSNFWASSFILRCSCSHSGITEYLAIESGGCMCTNSLHVLNVAWLNDCQRISVRSCVSRSQKVPFFFSWKLTYKVITLIKL